MGKGSATRPCRAALLNIAGRSGGSREGSPTGKRDAAAALLNIAGRGGGSGAAAAAAAAEAGAVGPLVRLLTDEAAGVADEALALCGCEEGKRGVGGERGLVPTLVEVVREGTEMGKENAVSLLLLVLCRDGGEDVGRRLLANPRSVPALQRLTASGSPSARRKADALLRLLNTRCIQSLKPIG